MNEKESVDDPLSIYEETVNSNNCEDLVDYDTIDIEEFKLEPIHEE